MAAEDGGDEDDDDDEVLATAASGHVQDQLFHRPGGRLLTHWSCV